MKCDDLGNVDLNHLEQKINEAIRERVASLGITVEDTDDKATLLEKERIYNEERQKIE